VYQPFALYFDCGLNLYFPFNIKFHIYINIYVYCFCRILVDNNPIRVMLNRQRIGVPFPTKRPMRVYTTLWNGDSWATRWGEVKIDLTNAPFVAGFKNFNAIACIANQGQIANCRNYNGGKYKGLDSESKRKMKQVLSKWVVYDYCADLRRYAHGLPYECRKENRIQLD